METSGSVAVPPTLKGPMAATLTTAPGLAHCHVEASRMSTWPVAHGCNDTTCPSSMAMPGPAV